MCSLTHIHEFQKYGIVRDLDGMFQEEPYVSKSHNNKVSTCIAKKSIQYVAAWIYITLAMF